MPRLHNSIAIDAAPDEVWSVLGDLAATPEWIPGVVSAEVNGSDRLCRTADGNEIRERIVDYSAEDRALSYEQSHVPLPIERSSGSLRVVPDGARTHVEWEAEFEAADEVAAMVDGYYRQTLEALKRRVESGETPATM
jgi:carbon monoxide dehydrogenase subunit G